jgi:FtsP/CotA-like multicopper oxidase with cupredoxin domain
VIARDEAPHDRRGAVGYIDRRAFQEPPMPSRRHVLLGAAALTAGAALPAIVRAGAHRHDLVLMPGTAALRGPDKPPTPIWGFGGTVPGAPIVVRQGDEVEIHVENRLAEETAIHWHGIRVPNAMDGVPGVTQPPIPPGGRFVYRFRCDDAGTYWYHPHGNSSEQIGRGLAGAFIVRERTAPDWSGDVALVLSDWRLKDDGTIDPDFADARDRSHEGRRGDTITANGLPLWQGRIDGLSRVRVRLVNAALARIFHPVVTGAVAWVVALDGHPVAPYRLGEDGVPIGPGMRADLVVDAPTGPQPVEIVDRPPAAKPHVFARFAVNAAKPGVTPARPAPAALPANPLAEPVLDGALAVTFKFEGGGHDAAGGHGGPARAIWAVNGVKRLPHGHDHGPPALTIPRGRSAVFTLVNDTMFDHPMHLHGMTFRVLSRGGKPVPGRPWSDTVLLAPNETAEIAFVADNPGDWMFHCHVLAHQESGMSAVVRVA